MRLHSSLFKIPVTYLRTSGSLACYAGLFSQGSCFFIYVSCYAYLPFFLETCFPTIVNYFKEGCAFARSTAISLISLKRLAESHVESAAWINVHCIFFLQLMKHYLTLPASKLLSSFDSLFVSNPCMCICKREYRRNGDPDVRCNKYKWYLILCCGWLFRLHSEKARDHIFILTVTLSIRMVSG